MMLALYPLKPQSLTRPNNGKLSANRPKRGIAKSANESSYNNADFETLQNDDLVFEAEFLDEFEDSGSYAFKAYKKALKLRKYLWQTLDFYA